MSLSGRPYVTPGDSLRLQETLGDSRGYHMGLKEILGDSRRL